MGSWVQFFTALSAAAMMDFMVVRWNTAATAGRVLPAVVWAVLVELAAVVVMYAVLGGYAGVIAGVLGSALGTAVSAYLARVRCTNNK